MRAQVKLYRQGHDLMAKKFFVTVMHRGRAWVEYLVRWRITTCLIAIAVAVYGVVLRVAGLGRSLWLDEAWVANSVATSSLAKMFYYKSWLQTSPPLFLVLVRETVAVFGLTNAALRAIPLLMGLLAMAVMFILARHLLLRRYALLATALFVLSPVAITYSRTLKQYSSELAASTTILLVCIMFLGRPTTQRFRLLVAIVAVGLLIAYAVAFVLPGIILVLFLFFSPSRSCCNPRGTANRAVWRGVVLATIAGGILIGEYILFVLPNDPSLLRAHWGFVASDRPSSLDESVIKESSFLAASDSYELLEELPIPRPANGVEKRLILGAVGSIVGVGFALACLRFSKGRRRWLELQALCVTPCLLLLIGDWFSWYPLTRRTSLFLLPFIVLLLASSLQLMSYFLLSRFHKHWLKMLLDAAVLGVILLMLAGVVRRTPLAISKIPIEDIDSAVLFLRGHVQSGDVLWVHASCSESFKLYARMRGWQGATVKYGQTGWPCCARGVFNYTSSEKLVRDDFSSVIPDAFSGRVWLLYTNRFYHWQILGVDEREIMKTILREKGCSETQTPVFHNVGVSSFNCKEHVTKSGGGAP